MSIKVNVSVARTICNVPKKCFNYTIKVGSKKCFSYTQKDDSVSQNFYLTFVNSKLIYAHNVNPLDPYNIAESFRECY